MLSVTDIIERRYGSRNWVLARKSPRILDKYGPDVVCLSPKVYRQLEKEAEIEAATSHPALASIQAYLGNYNVALGIIRRLREDGFRIEKARNDS